MLLPSNEPSYTDNALTSSLFAIVLAAIVYILVLLRSVLGTVQFWRVAVEGWGTGRLANSQWSGVVADLTAPIGESPLLLRFSVYCLPTAVLLAIEFTVGANTRYLFPQCS